MDDADDDKRIRAILFSISPSREAVRDLKRLRKIHGAAGYREFVSGEMKQPGNAYILSNHPSTKWLYRLVNLLSFSVLLTGVLAVALLFVDWRWALGVFILSYFGLSFLQTHVNYELIGRLDAITGIGRIMWDEEKKKTHTRAA